jgi:RNA polymerase sigma-70 factor (ECF subfamily)
LRAYLTRKVGNPDQADDLAQETFYRALKAFQGRRGWLPSAKEAYRPWLFRIATNLAIDLLRRRTCLTWRDLEAAAAVPTSSGREADPEEVYPHLEEAEAVRTTLGHLPDHSRRALVLRYHGGLTTPQVAQVIGLTPGGCKSLLKRARHAFARYYREQREVSA